MISDVAYLFALGSNLTFALGSQIFTHYSRKVSSVWMNFIKAFVSLILFALTVTIFDSWHSISLVFVMTFFLSGFLGLGLGDVFLLKSFSELGPGRTLMLFGFQPLVVGLLSYLAFDEKVDFEKLSAIFFFIICVFIFSLESFRKDRHWQIKGIARAFLGMALDATGLIITRYSFDHNPLITSMEGNTYRCIGAVSFFILLNFFRPVHFLSRWRGLQTKSKFMVILGSMLGTYISLGLYLKAIQTGHLASISGIAITGTIFSSLFECILDKKWPSRYLIAAFISFLFGMNILIF